MNPRHFFRYMDRPLSNMPSETARACGVTGFVRVFSNLYNLISHRRTYICDGPRLQSRRFYWDEDLGAGGHGIVSSQELHTIARPSSMPLGKVRHRFKPDGSFLDSLHLSGTVEYFGRETTMPVSEEEVP